MKNRIEELIKKLKRSKVEKTEEIPPGFVKCTKCKKIVKKEKAVLSLPEEWWFCDECFFGRAE